jgi:hypothetical protein
VAGRANRDPDGDVADSHPPAIAVHPLDVEPLADYQSIEVGVGWSRCRCGNRSARGSAAASGQAGGGPALAKVGPMGYGSSVTVVSIMVEKLRANPIPSATRGQETRSLR